MKLKKWLATVLAAVMAVGTLGALAGCAKKDPTTPPGGGGGGGDDDTAIQYYLVGSGLGILEISNWDQTSTDESLKFTRTGNTATITGDFYQGDQFQIIHNQAWDGQMGANILSNEGKDANDTPIFTEAPGGGKTPNIIVAEGQSGKYKLTLTLTSESDYTQNTLTWECLEKYDVAFATWYDIDDITEIAKTVAKKGAPLTPPTYDKHIKTCYEFDKWVTDKDNDNAPAFNFTTGTINENTSFYARIKESANTGYKLDSSTWQINDENGEKLIDLTRAPATEYKEHNVFIGTLLVEEGDKFAITNGTVANAEMTGMESSRVFDYEADYYTVLQAGNYQFTLVTEGVDSGDPTIKILRADKLGIVYNGYAIVGSYGGNDTWSKFVDDVTPIMTETEADSGIYKGTITTTTANVEIKVAQIVKNEVKWDIDGVKTNWGAEKDGTCLDGSNYVLATPGTYVVTVDTKNNTFTVVAKEATYYIVGTFGNDGNKGFQVNELAVQLEKGNGNTYTATFVVTDATTTFTWIKTEGGSDAIFAFKVAYVEADGTTIDWGKTYGMSNGQVAVDGDNIYITVAGTYTVTLDVDAGTVTWVKQ